jgi:hypothetical protein
VEHPLPDFRDKDHLIALRDNGTFAQPSEPVVRDDYLESHLSAAAPATHERSLTSGGADAICFWMAMGELPSLSRGE